jgi:hypothetical protein
VVVTPLTRRTPDYFMVRFLEDANAGTPMFMVRSARRREAEGGEHGKSGVLVQRPCLASVRTAWTEAQKAVFPGAVDANSKHIFLPVAENVLDMSKKCGVLGWVRTSAQAGKPANLTRQDFLMPWAPTVTIFFTTRKVCAGEELVCENLWG